MTIKTLWIWWKDQDGPSLACAWDDYDVDSNPDGWEKAWKQALAEAEGSISDLGYRFIDLNIRQFSKIEDAFFPEDVDVTVEAQ